MNILNLTCAWCFIANNTLLNIEWPDGGSQYYGTVINTTKFKLSGMYPNARYFSYELYTLDTWEPIWDIHDNMIDFHANPYIYNVSYNSSSEYSLNVNIKKFTESYMLIYRIYRGIDNTGGVELPDLELYYNNKYNTVAPCNPNTRPTIDYQTSPPDYNLYHANENNNFYLPQDSKKLFINYDARYLVSYYNNSNNDFLFSEISVKLPTFPHSFDDISTNIYDVRYYSLSVIDLSRPRQTTQTIYDELLFSNSENGYVKLYLFCHNINKFSLQLFPPTPDNSYNCSHNIEYFGILYRELLPDFKEEIPTIDNDKIYVIMGHYYPTIKWTKKS